MLKKLQFYTTYWQHIDSGLGRRKQQMSTKTSISHFHMWMTMSHCHTHNVYWHCYDETGKLHVKNYDTPTITCANLLWSWTVKELGYTDGLKFGVSWLDWAVSLRTTLRYSADYDLLISVPSLGVYYFLSLTCLSVCLFVTNIDSSFFVSRRNRAISGNQFSVTKTTKLCSYIFDLLPWQWNLGYFFKNFKLLLLFLFLDGIKPFLGRQFIVTPSTKRCS